MMLHVTVAPLASCISSIDIHSWLFPTQLCPGPFFIKFAERCASPRTCAGALPTAQLRKALHHVVQIVYQHR